MAELFHRLPHHLGTITNLDGSGSMRALISVKAELSRRQRIFREFGVNHINGYMRLFKEGNASEPIPHLFIICDEFAELKKEQPDFMKELVSAARIAGSMASARFSITLGSRPAQNTATSASRQSSYPPA